MIYQWRIYKFLKPNYFWLYLLYFFIVYSRTSLCNIVSLNTNDIYDKKEVRYFTPFIGTSFTIKCPLTFNNDYDQIRWIKDDKAIVSGGPIDIITDKLTINFVEPDHTGTYRCLVESEDGTQLSPIIYVYVKYFRKLASMPSSFYQVIRHKSKYIVLQTPPVVGSNEVEVKWTWHHNGHTITPNETHFISNVNGNLIILPTEGIFGNYIVEGDYGSVKEVSSTYKVEEDKSKMPPDDKFTLLTRPRDVIVSQRNNTIIFECMTSSWENVKIDWFLDGKLITRNEWRTIKITEYNRRLTIHEPFSTLTKKNSAETRSIKCRASSTINDKILDYAEGKVTLYDEPIIDTTNLPKIITIGNKTSLKLHCKILKGWPRPKYFWKFNGRDIITTHSGYLKIDPLTDKDMGIYQCDAINSVGSDTATIRVKRFDNESKIENISYQRLHDEVKDSNLYIAKKPVSKAISAGNDITLNCELNGAGETSWKFGETLIKNENNKYTIDGKGLTVHSVQLKDSGDYTCLAKNLNGIMVDEASAVISVISSNIIEYGPSNQSMLIGSNIEMPCKLSADYATASDVSVSWFWNNKIIPAQGDILHRMSIKNDNSLTINQVGPDNIGEYRCKVTTSDGKEEIVSAWLKIIEKPSMPHGVNVELINTTLPTKVKVLWQPGFDGNSPLIKHSIEMRTMGSAGIWSNWETIVENVPTEMCCSALIDNLKPSSTAEFRVVAFNRHGPGKPSIPSKQILIPQQPPAAAPRNVAASARSSTSVMVYWQPPPSEQWNGDILGYNVRYRLSGYATADWNVKNVSNNQERYVLLEPLITWRDYEIQVAAYNDRGLGVYSTPPFVVTTLEGVPLQSPQHIDVDVINSTAVNVSFEAPEQQMVPGQILGYKIEMWKDSFDNGESTPTRSIPLMPAYGRINSVITGLDKFGHYNLTILAFTSAGDGPRSEPKDVITEQDIPGPVKGLNFDQVLFSSVTVLWEPPTEKNGIITHYVVRCWKQGDKNSMKTFDLGPNETSVTIEGLSAQTKFIVDVVAHTEVGAGEIVEAKFESGVPPELPGKATNLRVSAISARTCLLDFIPGFDGHTIIQHWHVEAQIGFSNSFIPIFNISAPKAKSFKITGLRPNTRYIIRLVAENIKGFGAPSLPSDVFFTEKTIPEHPPEKVEAEPQMMNSIQVFWNLLPHSSWNGDLKGYVIQYRSLDLAKTKTKDNKVLENGFIVEDDYEDGADFEEEAPKYFPGKWKEIKTQNTKVSDFIITNLKAYTMYEIQVFAENTIGRSDPSPKVLVKTYENVPSSGPKNVKVDILGGRSINVFWDEVDRNNTNGIILGYIVRLSPEDSKLQKKYNKTIDIKGSNETSVKIVNLKPFTKYNTQVSAYTIVGNGISTFAKPIITPADVPDEPLDVTFSYVSETEVRIKWMPPENANGIISGYSIRYWKHGTSDEDAVNTQIPNSIYWFTATGLIPNTTYYFGVQAQNENSGWGQESIVKVLTTNIRAPQPIPIMLEHNKEMKDLPTDLYFKWNNPNLDNKSLSVEESPVRFVQIEYRSMKDTEFIPLTSHIAVTKRSAVISNLLPNTAYKARMKFIGDFQESPWSPETDWISTSQTYPFGAPTDFSVKPYQSTSVFLQWNSLPAEKWNSDVIGYRIEYKEYPSNGSFKIEELPLTNKISMNGVMTHILSHLTSFKHYIIRIQAFNKIGNSEFSVPKFVFVGYSTPKQKILGLLGKSITPTSITLDWKEWGKFEDDFISGYKVKYTTIVDMTNKEDRNVEEEILITEDNHIVLNDLKKYTEYQISVAGYNRAGDGESSIIRLKTLEGIPGVVSNLKFNNIMTNSVNVKWEEPLEPNGLILGYLVSYHASENNGYNQDKIFRVKENNVVLENLTENVHYKISVKAESIQGFGPSVTSEVRIGYGNPGTPSSPKKPNGVLKNYGILLSWENDKKDGESVTGFVIQGKRLSSVNNDTKENSDLIITSSPARIKRSTNESVNHLIGEWINLYNVNSDDKEYEINYEDLQPSSIYVFRVLQKNDIGVGNPSEESEHILVPAYKKRIIFYKEWWFIPVGAAILALILIFLLILLCKIIFSRRKKNKYVQKRKESLTDHQLNFVENARVNYELSNVNERRHDFLQTRPNTHNSWLSGDLPDNQVYGSIHSGDNQSRRSAMSPSVGLQALYGSLATDKIDFNGDQPTLVLSSFKPSSPSTSFLPNLAPTPGEIYARSRREDIPVRSMYEESVCMETMDQESLEYSTPTPLPTGELPHEQNYYEQCIRRVAPSTVTYASSETYSLNSSKPQSTNHYYTTSYQPRNSTHQGTHSNIPSSSPTSENMSSSSTIQDPGISLRSSIPPSPSTKYKSANLPKNGLSSFV